MKKLILAVFAAFLCTAAQAQWSGPALSRTYAFNLYNATTASAPGTVVATPVTGLDAYSYCIIYGVVQGPTGGTLDIYVQTSIDGGTTWVDIGHFAQLAAAAPAAGFVATISKWGPTVSNQPTSPPTSVNAVSGTPLLAANTFVAGVIGNQMRAVIVSGAGVSAGAAQVIKMYCSTSS